ncbi:MAG TPA: HAD family hydrolase [Candidatus Polarisedimenticolia bacterium]|nr:HAD family hydrolase [Candidatus Polarisedimenticolia bacterium]
MSNLGKCSFIDEPTSLPKESLRQMSEGSSAAFFDVDGTLVDSVQLHAACWHETFAAFGKQVPVSEISKQIGKGSDQLLPVFFSETEIARIGEEVDRHHGHLFHDKYIHKVRPFPKVRELLTRLREDGVFIALASSADREDLEHYKRLAGIQDLVDHETTSEEVEKSKPHPDLFAVALEALGAPPAEQVVVIGDSPYDSQAAGKLGLRTIGLLSGGFAREELLEAGCIEIHRDPEDLYDHYMKSILAALARPETRRAG